MEEYNDMFTGVAICISMFLFIIFANRCFSVSEDQYEKMVEEYGQEGRDFLVAQKLKYGSKIEVNNKLFQKLRHERVQAHYIKKDERLKKNETKEEKKEESKKKKKKA